jgi:hypothetical protein
MRGNSTSTPWSSELAAIVRNIWDSEGAGCCNSGNEESNRSNPGVARNSVAELNKVHSPDFSMRTREMSYFDLSTASYTFRAEQTDTSYSVDLPPQMIANRALAFFTPFVYQPVAAIGKLLKAGTKSSINVAVPKSSPWPLPKWLQDQVSYDSSRRPSTSAICAAIYWIPSGLDAKSSQVQLQTPTYPPATFEPLVSAQWLNRVRESFGILQIFKAGDLASLSRHISACSLPWLVAGHLDSSPLDQRKLVSYFHTFTMIINVFT